MNSESRSCQSCKQSFVIELEDFQFYEKMKVPPPTWCPECRLKRRFVFYNERVMYRRKCDATGKEIFAMFHQSSPYKIYDREYWWSDKWDPMSYGKVYDFSRSCFDQLLELHHAVPMFSRSIIDAENSDYCSNAGQLKDCYMMFNAGGCERCGYGTFVLESRDCWDCHDVFTSELCYDCVNCRTCNRAIACVDTENSHDVAFSANLRNCSNCFGCVNLRNKQYCIFNQQHTKVEYEKLVKDLYDGSREKYQECVAKRDALRQSLPVRFMHGDHNEGSTGEYVSHTKNVKDSFVTDNAENSRFLHLIGNVPMTKDCYDYSVWGQGAELVYESFQCGSQVYDLKFCWDIYPNSSRLEYCVACPNSSDLFGCVSLRNKRFCIFNKQYSEAEYHELVAKIKQHMDEMPYMDREGRVYRYGEFYPLAFSPFGYNESWLMDWFPLTKEEALHQGYSWKDSDAREVRADLTAQTVPTRIADTNDDILKKVIACADEGRCNHNCSKAFKVTAQELEFYRNLGLPLPVKCFSCRNVERLAYKNRPVSFQRACACAGKSSENGKYTNTIAHDHADAHCSRAFQSAYAPERFEIVYCEECYRSEIV